jgi:polar amino acid transport system ATP-binding protein
VLDVIKEIAVEGNDTDMTMLLITHEMDFAREIADRIVFFDEGVIVEQGSPDELFDNPKTPRLQTFLSRFNS